jgi:putative addiction module component (TIGR02574 family)
MPVFVFCMNLEFAPLFKLGRAERLQLVEDLWDSIALEDVSAPVPDSKRDELRRRKAKFLQHPASGRTWEQVKQRARSQHD